MNFDKDVEIIIQTDRYLQNQVKKGHKLACDVLIVDEWQNMSSDKQVALYRKIKRKYTIGLSATPIRETRAEFLPVRKNHLRLGNTEQ